MKTFITVTGADERTDVAALAKLDAEIGLLYTASPDGRNRYPRWEWILEASLGLARASLHICGGRAREQLMQGSLPVNAFQRIQVNGTLENRELRRICDLYPWHKIITQHVPSNRYLIPVDRENHVLLVDSSGGRGLSPEQWQSPVTDKAVGFAGGLGPDNLSDELTKIAAIARPGWWVDMEGQLRADDWFSIERAAECVEIFHREIPF